MIEDNIMATSQANLSIACSISKLLILLGRSFPKLSHIYVTKIGKNQLQQAKFPIIQRKKKFTVYKQLEFLGTRSHY